MKDMELNFENSVAKILLKVIHTKIYILYINYYIFMNRIMFDRKQST